MGDTKFGALVIFAVVGFLVAGGGSALVAGAQANAVDNESFSVDYTSDYSVAETGIEYRYEVTVRDKNFNELTRGIDYEWDESSGDVTMLDTSATNSGETAYVTYTVEQVTDESERYADLIGPLLVALALTAALILGLGSLIWGDS